MKKIPFKRKILIYLVFLAVSILLWMLDSLDREYKTVLNVPVEFENFPTKKLVDYKKLPDHLEIMVNGYGYAILSYNVKSKLKPIKINVAQLKLYPVNPNDTTHFYLLLHEAEKQISSQLKQNLKVLNISPDTVFISFIELKSKKLRVIPLVSITYAKQYRNVGQPVVKPKEVTVWGPTSILDSMEVVYTERVALENVNKDIDIELPVNTPKGTEASPDKVHFFLKVEMFTEKRVKVKITPTNVPQGYDLKLFPSFANVVFQVSISDYNRITADQFTLVVDFRDLENNPSDKLPVKLLYKPRNVYAVDYYPKVVDYILERKIE